MTHLMRLVTWGAALVVVGTSLAVVPTANGKPARTTTTTAPRRTVSRARLGRPSPPPTTARPSPVAPSTPAPIPASIESQLSGVVATVPPATRAPIPAGVEDQLGQTVVPGIFEEPTYVDAEQVEGRFRIATECRRCSLGAVSRFEIRGEWPAGTPSELQLTVTGPGGRGPRFRASRPLVDRWDPIPAWEPIDGTASAFPLHRAFSIWWRPDLAPGAYTITASVPGSRRAVSTTIRLVGSRRPAGPFVLADKEIVRGDPFRVILTGRAPRATVRLAVFRGNRTDGALRSSGESIEGVVGDDGVAEIIVETGPDTVPGDYCFDDGLASWTCRPTSIG